MRADNRNVFDRIAPVYGCFFKHQTKKFGRLLDQDVLPLDLRRFESAIDIGCGTGALCQVLMERGLRVSCVDRAERMLAVAEKMTGTDGPHYAYGDALAGLPFADDAFDLAFATHVAHGLPEAQRYALYKEMARLAKHYVILYDYVEIRSPLVALIERMEGSDYRGFMEQAKDELASVFSEVEIVPGGKHSAWYVCRA